MMFLRLVEKLMDRPHQHYTAQKVSEVADDLRQDVHSLARKMRPYVEAYDPLVALMTDVFNQRKMRNGNGSKPH
jgi:hypothetical protein